MPEAASSSSKRLRTEEEFGGITDKSSLASEEFEDESMVLLNTFGSSLLELVSNKIATNINKTTSDIGSNSGSMPFPRLGVSFPPFPEVTIPPQSLPLFPRMSPPPSAAPKFSY